VLAAVAAAVVALAGCGGGVQTLTIPDPPAVTVTLPTPPESLPPGLASRSEAVVPGSTSTTAPVVGPGPASINGTVIGPGGPLQGATVQVERFVGDAVATARTTTAADGSFAFKAVLGGRYRIRAWMAPTLDMTTPQIVFVQAGQSQPLTLQLASFSTQSVTSAINPSEPIVNQTVDLVVQVTDPTVDADGFLVNQPAAGARVTLVNGTGWEVETDNPGVTDGAGRVLFRVFCTATGPDSLEAQVGSQDPVSITLPGCFPPPTTSLPGTTTTSCPTPTTVIGEPLSTSLPDGC
jgi:hypothetical protein